MENGDDILDEAEEAELERRRREGEGFFGSAGITTRISFGDGLFFCCIIFL